MIHTYITHLFSTTRAFPRADCLPKLVYIRDVIKKLMGTVSGTQDLVCRW